MRTLVQCSPVFGLTILKPLLRTKAQVPISPASVQMSILSILPGDDAQQTSVPEGSILNLDSDLEGGTDN